MSNTGLTSLAPILLAKGHQVLRRRLPFLIKVNKDYAKTPMGKDSTIPISIPSDYGVAGDAAAAAYFDPPDHSNTTRNLSLTSHKEKGFYLTDVEIARIAKEIGYIPNQLESAVESIARAIAVEGWLTYKSVYGFVGTPGTTPYGSATDVAVDLGKVLDDQLCPSEDRVHLVNSKAKANVLKLDSFKSFDKRGDVAALRDAELGRFLGFDWFLDQAVPLHTKGTLSDGSAAQALINGAVAAGATTMNIDSATLTGTLVTGDVFTVAGDDQTYVVVTGGTAAANAMAGVTFQPPSVAGFADGLAVTLKGSHRVNLAFHKNGIYFGSRLLKVDASVVGSELGNAIFEEVLEDPVTGIVLRLSVTRQKYRVVWNFDALFGWLLARPELVARLGGEAT